MGNEKFDPKEIEDLAKALEAGGCNTAPKHLTEGSPLQVGDESETAGKYLTDKAKVATSIKSTQLVYINDDSSGAKAIFFGKRTTPAKKEEAVKEICTILNELAEEKLIHSLLSNVTSISFAKMAGQKESMAVVCYPLIPFDKYDQVKEKYKNYSFEEGGTPPSTETFDLDLAEGEFYVNINVSQSYSLVVNKTLEELLDKEIATYLGILPEGTTVKEVTRCAQVSLAVPFEVKFFNPLLKKVHRVEIVGFRSVETVGGSFKQFNVITGMRYYDKQGVELYK